MKRRSGYGWLQLIIGIILIICSIMSFAHIGTALRSVIFLYGCIAVFTGINDIIFYIRVSEFLGFGPMLSLISGIVSVMTGVLIMVYPGAGEMILAFLFPIWFLAHCISHLSQAGFVRRRGGAVSYYCVMIANIIGIILAIFMLLRPVITLMSLNIIIGIYLLILGIESLILGIEIIRRDNFL